MLKENSEYSVKAQPVITEWKGLRPRLASATISQERGSSWLTIGSTVLTVLHYKALNMKQTNLLHTPVTAYQFSVIAEC